MPDRWRRIGWFVLLYGAGCWRWGALGFSAAGVVARDVFGTGGRVTVGAGLGYGLSEGSVGGKARVQFTW